MKSKKNTSIIFITSIFVLTFALLFLQMNTPIVSTRESELKGLRSSTTYTSVVEIDATNPTKDWAIALAAGVCTGSGTSGDPYIIEDHLFQITTGAALVISNSRAYFRIENCTYTNPALAPTVVMLNTTNGIANDNLFGAVYQAFLVDNSSQISLTHNNFTACGYTITISNSRDFTINLNSIIGSVYDSITLDNCIDFLVEENDIVFNNALGILLDDSEYITIVDNLIDRSNYGMVCVISDHISIMNNEIYNSITDGIYQINSEFFAISGNTFINNSNTGLLIEDSHNNSVTSNTFTNGGIEIAAASMDNEINGNEISFSILGINIIGNSQFNLLQANQLNHNALEGISISSSHNNSVISIIYILMEMSESNLLQLHLIILSPLTPFLTIVTMEF